MFSIWMWPAWLMVIATGHFLGVRYGLLAVLFALAVYYDWTSRKIPNNLVLAGTVMAILLQSVRSDGIGLLASFEGLGLGLIMLLPLYLARAMGAGDVKLMAMTGAFLGPNLIIGAVLGTFVAGLFLGLAFAARSHAMARLLTNLKLMLLGGVLRLAGGRTLKLEEPPVSVGKMPYALAISTGTLGYLSLPLVTRAFS